MDKILAIKGHPTRGSEVIEILEMLGGKNKFNFIGNEDKWLVLNGNIQQSNFLFDEKGFTLEEFLEKYPFKVGDKVKYKKFQRQSDFIYIVKKMIWENNQIKYIICNPCYSEYSFTLTSEDLQLYEDEIYIDYPVDNDSKPGLMVDGEKLIAPKGYAIKTATMDGNNLTVEYVKKQPQYPKTYKECCDALDMLSDWHLSFEMNTYGSNDLCANKELEYVRKLEALRKLRICRDAYWKIAGEEMGLGKPWEPNWTTTEGMPAIFRFRYNIVCDSIKNQQCLLVFPTKEMRDAFFENFKDLIEECKEFL